MLAMYQWQCTVGHMPYQLFKRLFVKQHSCLLCLIGKDFVAFYTDLVSAAAAALLKTAAQEQGVGAWHTVSVSPELPAVERADYSRISSDSFGVAECGRIVHQPQMLPSGSERGVGHRFTGGRLPFVDLRL